MRTDRTRSSWIGILLVTLLLEALAIGVTVLLAKVLRASLENLISLGQLVVALLLIPLAVVAFWEARAAVAQAAATPRLRMAFLGEDGLLHDTYTLRLPKEGRDANRVTLAIENRGDAIAVWWQASFDLPVDLVKLIRLGNGQINVMQRQVPIVMDTVGSIERRIVQSAGTLALFPGPPIQIATINARLDPTFPHQFAAEYTLAFELLTNKTRPMRGNLPLRVEKA